MMWTTRPRSEGAGDLSYWQAGAGPTLVLIHGVGLRAEAWGGMMPLLTERFTVYAVDMPGHGTSQLGKTRQLEDYVDRIQDFVSALDGPVCVAGHSMGAILSMKLAARGGLQIAGVGALNAIYRRSVAAQSAVAARAQAIVAGKVPENAPTLARWFGTTPESALKSAAEACNGWLSGVNMQAYGRAYTVFAQQDGPGDAELAAITCPALFMTGARDLNSTPAMSQTMAAIAPNGQVTSIADAAHMMPMTHPRAVADALIRTFEHAGAQT